MREIRVSIFLFSIALIAMPGSAVAEPVYKWTDKQGVSHYSTTPPNPEAKPADLPRITRGDVRLTEVRLETCENHGGIDCQAGPDTDGTVICYDGYRNAAAVYRFNCNSPKLEVSDISDINSKGEFVVSVRNSKSVAAEAPEIMIRPSDLPTAIKLIGPETIDPFGVAEFTYKPEVKGLIKNKPTLAQLTLTCSNCP